MPVSNNKKSYGCAGVLRLGLCCKFLEQPIKFRTATATALQRLSRREQLVRLAEICTFNAASLLAALHFCAANKIASFRISSAICPVKTHPTVGYRIEQLPGADEIIEQFRRCGVFSCAQGIRTGFHPDQFVVLNSPDENVVTRAIADIESQAEIADWTNADTINIHGGGGYGDKPAALARFRRNLGRLSSRARQRLTVENDDRTFTPNDLLEICQNEGVPLVYDVHHHRCHPDGLSIEQATEAAIGTWNREPLFHISSPREGWQGPQPRHHHDYIDPQDFPSNWLNLAVTIEVEAKAKELALLKLKRDLTRSSRHV